MPQFESIKLLGVRVDNVGWPEIDHFIEHTLKGDTPQQIVTVNGEFILTAQKNAAFREVINSADLVIPDSTNVVWVSRVKGRGLKEQTAGADLVLHLAKVAEATGKSVYLLGGWGDVPVKAAKALQQHFPNLKIAGTSTKNPDDLAISAEIKHSHADIVLVGYGAPTQDLWIASHKDHTGAKILVGVGGTFDMLAGHLPRAPKFFRTLHLEWLWRLILQPKRIGRIWKAVLVFPLKALFG